MIIDIKDGKTLEENAAAVEHRFHDGIQCFVVGLTYSFDARIGMLSVSEHSSTDIGGTREFFQAIDPEVQTIVVVQGAKIDIIYYRHGDAWLADDHRHD